MKLNRKLNTLTAGEYLHLLANYRKFTDFNHLGLFRSILENAKLTSRQQEEIRDAAVQVFPKFFEFLQLKDPVTYRALVTLNQSLTVADEQQLWEDIRRNQQQLLAARQIRHRSIGTYALHDCGYETCPLNGLMVRQGSWMAEGKIHFHTDKNDYAARARADLRKRDRKQRKQLIERDTAGSLDVPFQF